MVEVLHQWTPDDWETFALCLLQGRHGALHVHRIPAKHRGDLGIDFYCTTERVIYQCYAVDEPVDISIRADRQKSKITTDLKKVEKNQDEISKLFLGATVEKWILLVPLHDSREVNLHCAAKTSKFRGLGLKHLAASFEICVQDLSAFPGASVGMAMGTVANISLSVPPPTLEEVTAWREDSSDLLANARRKMSKRVGPEKLNEVVSDGVEHFLTGTAVLDALRASAPDLHEKIAGAIARHARRLDFAGPKGGSSPNAILHTELEVLMDAINHEVPSLSRANTEDIALGVISEWIMRCPLDFPPDGI